MEFKKGDVVEDAANPGIKFCVFIKYTPGGCLCINSRLEFIYAEEHTLSHLNRDLTFTENIVINEALRRLK